MTQGWSGAAKHPPTLSVILLPTCSLAQSGPGVPVGLTHSQRAAAGAWQGKTSGLKTPICRSAASTADRGECVFVYAHVQIRFFLAHAFK